MITTDVIVKYIAHQRCLGKRFVRDSAMLFAFCESVGDIPLSDIRSDMIRHYLNREGTSDETVRRKHRALAGFFRFVVTRHLLKASPMPRDMRKRGSSTYTPYIYTDSELKRLLEATPAAASPNADIDHDTLRTFLLLLYGAGLRRGEAMRLKVGDIDTSQSLIHIRATKFFKTRIVPLSESLNGVMRSFLVDRGRLLPMEVHRPVFCKRNGQPLCDSIVSSAFRRACA